MDVDTFVRSAMKTIMGLNDYLEEKSFIIVILHV
jgi:hypothetical protein